MDAPALAHLIRPALLGLHTIARWLVQYCLAKAPLPRFEAALEQQFWRERNADMLQPVQIILLLGAAGFFAFVLLDAATQGLSMAGWAGRLLVVVGLLGLYVHLRRQTAKPAGSWVGWVASVAAAMATLNLAGTLLAENNPAGYPGAWAGLLPVYFFTYGQLAMPLRASLVFGWMAMAMLLAAGHAVGVPAAAWWTSLLILGIVNLFGLCTRCQLEGHSRRSFQQRHLAERAAENKARFLRQASHNLRQPLQALSCYATVLEGALAQQRFDEAQHSAAKLGSTIDQLNDAFNRILDVANLECGRQISAIAEVEINPLLAALESQFAPQAAQRGLVLKVVPRSQPPFTVQSDASLLRQILGNLLDNALKYTRSGWVMVASVKTGGNRLKLHVRDSGIGIAEGEKTAIFTEFYRGGGAGSAAAHGLGIGLAYVAKALEHLPEHRLTLHSHPMQGSDFSLHLPCGAQAGSGSLTLAAVRREWAGCYVWLLDSEAGVRQSLAEQLGGWGCRVEQAGSLAEWRLALADSLRPPDLLIADGSPSQSEILNEALAALQADCGPLPVVILSTSAVFPNLAHWPAPTRTLRKPATAPALLQAMAEAMGGAGGNTLSHHCPLPVLPARYPARIPARSAPLGA